MGGPKLTVTGYGIRRGHFQRKRRFSKLKMLPHTPSSATGTIGRLHVLHDLLHAAAERQQLPDARDLTLGENANHVAGANGLAGGAQGLEQVARPLRRGDREWRRGCARTASPRATRKSPANMINRTRRSVEAMSNSASTKET